MVNNNKDFKFIKQSYFHINFMFLRVAQVCLLQQFNVSD